MTLTKFVLSSNTFSYSIGYPRGPPGLSALPSTRRPYFRSEVVPNHGHIRGAVGTTRSVVVSVVTGLGGGDDRESRCTVVVMEVAVKV